MKKIIIIVFSLLLIIGAHTSCEDILGDYLSKPSSSDVTSDTVFASIKNMEQFLAVCYEYGVSSEYPGQGIVNEFGSGSNAAEDNFQVFACMTDEGEYGEQTGHNVLQSAFNNGSITVAHAIRLGRRWPQRWTAIRKAYIMIDNIDKVPGITSSYANQIKGEMKFIIAHNYFEMFKRMGGLPIVTKAFDPNDDMKIQRSSLNETFQFIIDNCDDAINYGLPDEYPSYLKGRITKGAVLSLKAKAWLYAASPLFNTNTPYMNMTDIANNKLICFGDYDVARWDSAAFYANKVIEWAPSGNIALIEDQGADKNYKYAWEVPDNAEIILANKVTSTWGKLTTIGLPCQYILPRWSNNWCGTLTTHNFVMNHYEKVSDGILPVWPESGTGVELNALYASLDPRLKQTVGYIGNKYLNVVPFLDTSSDGAENRACLTGYWAKKPIPDAQTKTSRPPTGVYYNWTLFRLAEFYLIKAEALNESKGPISDVYNAVNKIRLRSGMPELPVGLTKEEMRERIRREWAVEFAYEDHRYWDAKRWKIAEQVIGGPIYGLKIDKISTAGGMYQVDPGNYNFNKVLLENRTFSKHTYLDPFKESEVNKGYITQNPGY